MDLERHDAHLAYSDRTIPIVLQRRRALGCGDAARRSGRWIIRLFGADHRRVLSPELSRTPAAPRERLVLSFKRRCRTRRLSSLQALPADGDLFTPTTWAVRSHAKSQCS